MTNKRIKPENGPLEKKDELVGMDCGDLRDVPSDTTPEDAVRGLDWLFGPLDSGGGGSVDWADDPLEFEADSDEPLDSAAQLANAALSYGASQDGGRYNRFRRLKEDKTVLTIEEFFGGDDDAVFLATVTREIVQSALLDGDDWGFEWIFGASQLQTAERPSRRDILEFFGAREIVLQTRMQYQMLREHRKYSMRFICPGLDRMFLWKLTGLLAKQGQLIAIDHAVTIMEQLWRNPGVEEDRLWHLYTQQISNQPSQLNLQPDLEAFNATLVFLDLDYLTTKSERNNGLYLTGRNPSRAVEEMRKDRQNFNYATMSRGWSSWW